MPTAHSLLPSSPPLRADSSCELLSECIRDHYSRGEPRAAFNLIRETLADRATINGQPAASILTTLDADTANPLAPLRADLSLIFQFSEGDNKRVIEHDQALHPDGTSFIVRFVFEPLAPDRWRIRDLTIQAHAPAHQDTS